MGPKIRIRVYLEDTDAGGIVYHATHLRFMERGRTDFIRHLGLNRHNLTTANILFVVRKMVINYRLPAYLDDELEVYTRLTRKGKCFVYFIQEIVRIRNNDLISQADVEVVCVDAERKKPRLLPKQILSLKETG